jgi:hypothetical protein
VGCARFVLIDHMSLNKPNLDKPFSYVCTYKIVKNEKVLTVMESGLGDEGIFSNIWGDLGVT